MQGSHTGPVLKFLIVVAIVVVGFFAAAAIWNALEGRSGIDAAVSDATGQQASCSQVGAMLFLGEREDVHRCSLGVSGESRCYVYADGDLYDVTDQVTAIRDLGGADLGC